MNIEQIQKIKEENNLHTEQNLEELQWLINKVLEITGPPKVILEIGTSHGGTLKYWEQISEENALIIGIDKRERELVSWDIENSSMDIHHIQGDSHSPETLSKVEHMLGGKAVDFLFIDGDHSGVKADYEDYSKFVRNAGVVGFHDVGPKGPCRQFFDEIKTPKYPSSIPKEIFHKTIGIGYVRMLITGTKVCDAIEDADKVLVEFTELAESLHLKSFLCDGTCLGMVREGGYIEGDNDIDVGVIYNSYSDVLKLHKTLRDSKFRAGHMCGAPNDSSSCCYWKDDNILLCIGYLPTYNLKSPEYMGWKYYPFVKSFQTITYKGREYNVPSPVEDYLEAHYGDWKTPKRRLENT